MIEIATSEDEEKAAKPARPANPRRAPDVVAALAYAARRDPHPDPFKALGRASFLIWGAMLFAFVFISGPVRQIVDVPKIQSEALSVVHGVTGTERTRERTLKKITRNDHAMEVAAVTGFAAGTSIFAAYYFLIYVVAMNLRRVTAQTHAAILVGSASFVAWQERQKAKHNAVKPDMVVEQTPAGPAPHIQ